MAALDGKGALVREGGDGGRREAFFPGRPDSGWISGQNLSADGGFLP